MAVGVNVAAALSPLPIPGEYIINPPLGVFTGGGAALTQLTIPLPGANAILVGSFLTAILNFLIMAFVVFCLVKAINRLHRKKDTPPAAPAAPPAPSQEEVLLREIRDLLKAQNGQ